MNEKLRNSILTLYERGLSLREIGSKLVMSHETVRKMIPADKMRRKRIDEGTVNKIKKTFLKSQSFQETAEILGLRNRQTVYRVIAREGLL